VRDRLLRDGYVILAVVFVALRLLEVRPWADSVDAYAYWATRSGDLYGAAKTGAIGAYLYSPAFAQALNPFTWLPLNVFAALWTAVNAATLWFLVGRWALPSLLFLPIPFEIVSGNVHLLYAAAIVLGFRVSATWALPILTKVTPGIGVVWFLIRREWRAFALAIGTTVAIGLASFALDQNAWRAWIDVLQGGQTGAGQGAFETVGWYVPVALAPRLVVALVVVVVAAWRNARWLLPVAVTLALPVLWLNGFAVLAGCVPLWRRRRTEEPSRAAATSTGSYTAAVV
jgi:hypothetical protein